VDGKTVSETLLPTSLLCAMAVCASSLTGHGALDHLGNKGLHWVTKLGPKRMVTPVTTRLNLRLSAR